MLPLDDPEKRHQSYSRPPDLTDAEAALHDAALMQLVQEGDERAFATLYDRRSPAILAAILRIVPERIDAESVLLEVFAQAWREKDRYSATRSPVLSWLFIIARSRALDCARSSTRTLRLMPVSIDQAPDSALEAKGHSNDPSRGVEDEERSAIVASALSALTPLQRTAIELAFFDGLTHSEIAERLQEPLGTIKSRIRLAMGRLRNALHPSSRELAT